VSERGHRRRERRNCAAIFATRDARPHTEPDVNSNELDNDARADGDARYPADAIVEPDRRPSAARRLGDFTLTPRAAALALLAIPLGVLVTAFALGLLDLIALVTHLAYTGTVATSLTNPDIHKLGALSVLVPVAGGLAVGVMARIGSERIRGHGIPEAMETILLRGSRMEPRLAVLKPLSSAISIGTGGPFGAEGPIIVTGGAVGSIAGQLLHLSAAERRGLLVAGAAAGMTAVFGTPLASVLLAVELLLFEWRPRSLLPAALAAASAAAARQALARHGLLHPTPLFATNGHATLPFSATLGAVVVGLAGGALAWLMTRCVYGAEDAFGRLPLHWSWWPPIGGVVVGLGGLIEPRALGVGYATIAAELKGNLALDALLVLLAVKLVIWSVALGSNTSGGILAPVLLIGAALGGILGSFLPGAGEGTWALIGMAAALAGVMRSPLTSIVFALELTHDVNALLVLLVACVLAHMTSVLTLRRSILTEKVARRGYHVTREYEIDPLHALLVRDAIGAAGTRAPNGAADERERPSPTSEPLSAHPYETLREVADRMLASGRGTLPVIDDRGQTVGRIVARDVLRAHERTLVEERRRERTLAPRRIAGRRAARHEDSSRPDVSGR
jgi:CIC family chloride channel protein